MPRRGRHRLRILLGVVLCLLFQQVAFAAYACAEAVMPPPPAAMAAGCDGMGMEIPEAAASVCADQCIPDPVVAPEWGAADVPPLALPPRRFADEALPTGACSVPLHDVPVDRSDPPPRLRYCSLLI